MTAAIRSIRSRLETRAVVCRAVVCRASVLAGRRRNLFTAFLLGA